MRQPAVGVFDASTISEQERGHKLGTWRVQGDFPEYECLMSQPGMEKGQILGSQWLSVLSLWGLLLVWWM